MATHFTIVTGNQNKLNEYHLLLPAFITFDSAHAELKELQSLDITEIVRHKAQQAYQIVKKPVLVEDVTAGLDKFEGLPGPFIKFFEQQLGKDALYKLAGEEATPAVAMCTIGYYDGAQLVIAQGIEHGSVVSPRGKTGWGFDFVFIPEGQTQTFAEMGPAMKAKISHRSLAVKDLLAKLKV